MKKTEITKIRKNGMGTTSFDLQVPGMRKAQDFIVYPLDRTDSGKKISIQSDNRFGEISLIDGKGVMSATHPTSANYMWLALCQARKKTTAFEITPEELMKLKVCILGTADENAGNSVMTTDNSGASKVMDV